MGIVNHYFGETEALQFILDPVTQSTYSGEDVGMGCEEAGKHI